MRWAGHVARIGERRHGYIILIGKHEGKRPLGRPRRRKEDNIRIDLRELVWEVVDWIRVAKHRDYWLDVVNTVMSTWVP
jgi:hypothetical protein